MKHLALFTFVGLLVLTSLACSLTVNLPTIQVGNRLPNPETLQINEPVPAGSAKLNIGMGAGKLTITGGGEGLVSGDVRYNVAELKPEINHQGSEITIEQKTEKFGNAIGSDVVNEWNIRLGNSPLELVVNAGAYEGTLDLSGVPLTRLQINDGASKAKVMFNQPNPQVMSNLSYKTGASTVELNGLGNANFQQMTFGGGAGAYTLDFGGKLQRDAQVNITSGVSTIKIIIPSGTHARVETTGGLNNINEIGQWQVNGQVYEATGEGPLLSIKVDMGVGSLELTHQ